MDSLVYAEQTKEVGRGGVGSGATLAFPKRGAQIISLREDGALAYVETVGKSVEMKKAAC
jgi:hypothetical protein